MKEFNDFLDYCYTNYTWLSPNCNSCTNNHFCTNNNCAEGNCAVCLNHILRSQKPNFHYSCKRITYYYVLRFLNRFASEIKPFFSNNFGKNHLNIVSLGCGPASELYGLVNGIRTYHPDMTIVYRGYDTEQIWEELNNKTIELFAHDPSLDIKIHRHDMFNEWQDNDITEVDILILNYLLSDCIKYQNNKSQLEAFLNEIVSFIIKYKVKIIVCNDINLFGYPNCHLDSSVKCMDYIKNNLSIFKNINGLRLYGFYYPSDRFKPDGWHEIQDESLLFNPNPLYSQFTTNIDRRASKFMILITDFA